MDRYEEESEIMPPDFPAPLLPDWYVEEQEPRLKAGYKYPEKKIYMEESDQTVFVVNDTGINQLSLTDNEISISYDTV